MSGPNTMVTAPSPGGNPNSKVMKTEGPHIYQYSSSEPRPGNINITEGKPISIYSTSNLATSLGCYISPYGGDRINIIRVGNGWLFTVF